MTKSIPFYRVQLTDEEIDAVEEVLRSGWLTTGKHVAAFEREFAMSIADDVEAVAVNSNTAGLHLSLEALGIGPGDEVIVPVMTFTATAEVVCYLGAKPVFVDVHPQTLCIDPTRVEEAITSRTKAIIPVHFGGVVADIPALKTIASAHGLTIVEDAAHAFPASLNGTPVGAFDTQAAVFSFYANKPITTGEGGMIVTRDTRLAQRMRTMRLHGIDRAIYDRFTNKSAQWEYDVVAPGYKYNMPDIAAALGRKQLNRASDLRNARKRIANMYIEAFKDLPVQCLPEIKQGVQSSYHLFILRVNDEIMNGRKLLEKGLTSHGIGYSVHYKPLHMHSFWKQLIGDQKKEFPVAESHFRQSLSLPLFPSMTDEEVQRTIVAVRETFNSLSHNMMEI